jgi:3',5'-cyclic AMP phosphodiesterase CpdA
MKLYAISDLHLGHTINRSAVEALAPHPEDWLILAGDIGEREDDLHFALSRLTRRFAQLVWAPGNHDLWTLPSDSPALRGEAKYHRLVAICRSYGVLTPEDPYVLWSGEGPSCLIAPLFLLYDYSFRPDEIPANHALAWAEETGIVCTDEMLLHPDPYPSRPEWCAARCRDTEQRLHAIPAQTPLVLINHFPLRYDLVQLPWIPRFSLWCGTRRTETWHTRFTVRVVVYGHLHRRGTQWRDGVRFEEVSFGYPRDWQAERGLQPYMREILPGPTGVPPDHHELGERTAL